MEELGTVASVIVLISFLFEDNKTIRLVNIIGCIVFIIYGITISSFSIIFLNTSLLLVNIYKLLKK